MKHSSDTTGNRTRDLPACSAVLQPTSAPRVPMHGCMHVDVLHFIPVSNPESSIPCSLEQQEKDSPYSGGPGNYMPYNLPAHYDVFLNLIASVLSGAIYPSVPCYPQLHNHKTTVRMRMAFKT